MPEEEERQCRICFEGVEAERELGRLIRPCLCRGSISYVHIGCLRTWRNAAASESAFFQCPQCRYQYRFARTRIVGLATNPIIIGVISALLFTAIVMAASFVTTYFMSSFEEPGNDYYYSFFYISPFQVAQDLITAAFRILKDGNVDIFDEAVSYTTSKGTTRSPIARQPPGLLRRFVRRFLLGLPLVGAGSIVQLLLSVGGLAPVRWVARFRGSRNRRNDNSRDIAALIIITLVVLGAARALYKVYVYMETLTKKALSRAEDAILEVNV
ncbi:hypothetical protein D9619_003448 [Psilocybe cf. subviscida]|uniref:RING-CH-type domain-containing protein n=1 Tax=Psilocybe cf. subviscida TaxID=2480587 RepID=A0A8H5AY83_9AGAR|nr:hypothetical protein D9619_003448 [Psilocybe cf. subviscida]